VNKEGKPISDDRLDELLDAVPDVEPSAALMRAVAEIPIRHPRSVAAWWPFGGARRWLAVATAALAMGAALGVALPSEGDDARVGIESDDDLGWDALSTVATGADVFEELGQ
jgi:hypothetical protein